MTPSVDVEELKRLLALDDPVTLLDVRRKADYEADPRQIEGAAWHDPEQIDAWIAQLPAGRRTVAYCVKGGAVSQSVAERLCREGYDGAFLEGGLKRWIESA